MQKKKKNKQDGRAIKNKSFQNNHLNSHLASQTPTAYNFIHNKLYIYGSLFKTRGRTR